MSRQLRDFPKQPLTPPEGSKIEQVATCVLADRAHFVEHTVVELCKAVIALRDQGAGGTS